MKAFPFYKQFDFKDCGPAVLRMMAQFYGKHYSLEYLREITHIGRYGTSLLGLSDGAEEIGFRTMAVRLKTQQLFNKVLLPCVVLLEQHHFVIVYKVKKDKVYVANPAFGLQQWFKNDFLKAWLVTKESDEGIALLLEPSPEFYDKDGTRSEKKTFTYFYKYLTPYKKEFFRILIGLLFGTVVSLIIPFLSQSVIDIGINNHNLDFVQLVIVAQIILLVSSSAVGFIQNWLSLHIGSKMTISMLSDFISKMLSLPVSFFNNRSIGDILQRMGDNGRILSFISNSPLTFTLSLLNLFIYGIVMLFYSTTVLTIFAIGNTIYSIWLFQFLKKRRDLDFERFGLNTRDENLTIEMISGIQDIKLNNLEKTKRWEWETIQAEKYDYNIRSLRLIQIQKMGAMFIHQTKNIIISYLAAKFVIDGQMTLGMMFAIQYMIGRLEQPFSTFIGYIHSIQDVKISLERLSEVTAKESENQGKVFVDYQSTATDIYLKNVTFRYEGKSSSSVLDNISCTFPKNSITAIVGKSGSGKTTLLKLLLKLYQPNEGEICIDNLDLNNIRNENWRSACGSVMADGYIFNDTILFNICMQKKPSDMRRVFWAANLACINNFIQQLPMSYHTKVGKDHVQMSAGERQRLLLARAIYKNSDFLILDEATNSLDPQMQKAVNENLNQLKKTKTIIIAAHDLNTVRCADSIVVINDGEVVQCGTHDQLVQDADGAYYKLVTEQLNL